MTERQQNIGTSDPQDKNSRVKWLGQHPMIVGTFLYVYVALIGSSFQWWLLKGFGVNYFDFAEVNDFLTAGFKSPFAIGQGIVTLVILMFVAYQRSGLSGGTESRIDETKTLLARWLIIVLFVIAYTLGPGISVAHWGRQDIRKGYGTYVSVEAVRGAKVINSFESLMLLATTDKFVIFYEWQHHRTLVIPTANIAQMRICRTPPPWSPWKRTDEVDEPCDPDALITNLRRGWRSLPF